MSIRRKRVFSEDRVVELCGHVWQYMFTQHKCIAGLTLEEALLRLLPLAGVELPKLTPEEIVQEQLLGGRPINKGLDEAEPQKPTLHPDAQARQAQYTTATEPKHESGIDYE